MMLVVFSGFVFYFLFLHNRVHLAPLPYIGPRLGTEVNPETGEADTIYHTIPDFKLVNERGDTVTGKDVFGHIYVADFFYATCRSICPVMTHQMKRVQDAYAKDEDVRMLSHTVDPANDSVGALKVYAELHEAIPGKWQFLTGPKKDLYKLAMEGYFMNALEGSTPEDPFIHDNHFVLVDKERHIRGIYDGTDSVEVSRLIDEIRVLEKFYQSPEQE